MAGSKSRRLAWLIQKLEETRSTNASRRDRAIRAWLRPGGIMAMIVEALALAEELDGGHWFNWVDQPGEPKRHLATFPSRAQYERVLKGKGPKYHAARKYVRYVYGRGAHVWRMPCGCNVVHGWDDGPPPPALLLLAKLHAPRRVAP